MNEMEAKSAQRQTEPTRAGAGGTSVAAGAPVPVAMPDEDVITLADIIALIRENRRLIAWCVGVSFLLGLAYALFKTPEYRATVVIQPVEEEAGAASSLASRFGGLASLAGINLGGGGNKEEYLGVLRSRELAERFITRYNVMPELFPELWDAERGDWIAEPPVWMRLRDGINQLLATLSGDEGFQRRVGAKPTMGEAFEEFDENVRDIMEVPRSTLYQLSIRAKNPARAALWANAYVAMANEEIRNRTIAEAEAVIQYLQAEANRTTDVQLKNSIFGLIQSQLQRMATARARPEYAFRVIDPAKPPEDPAGLSRVAIVILAVFFGGVVAGSFLFFTTILNRARYSYYKAEI